jgi:Mce-associated membrane protein
VSDDMTTSDPPAPRRRPALLPALALVVATAVLVSGLVAWWRAGEDEEADVAAWRDSALVAARAHVETMNSLDTRDMDAGLAAWAEVTTGTLHDQFAEIDDAERALFAEQGTISVGHVVDAAVIEVDATTATVIASVEITVRDDADPMAEPTLKRNRFRADLLRVGGEWKVEDLQQVGVTVS